MWQTVEEGQRSKEIRFDKTSFLKAPPPPTTSPRPIFVIHLLKCSLSDLMIKCSLEYGSLHLEHRFIYEAPTTAHKQVPSGATFLNFRTFNPNFETRLEDFKSRFLTNKHYTRWKIDVGYMLNKGKGRFWTFYSFSILLFDPGLKYRFCRHLNKIGPIGIEPRLGSMQ